MLQMYSRKVATPSSNDYFMCDLWLQLLLIIMLFSFGLSLKLEVQQDADSAIAQKQLQEIYKQTRHMKYGEVFSNLLLTYRYQMYNTFCLLH